MDGMVVFVPLGNQHHGRSRYRTPVPSQPLALRRDRNRLLTHGRPTVAAIQLLDRLPSNPVVIIPSASKLLGLTAPPASKAIGLLEDLGILREITGKRRGRAYEYQEYLQVLTEDEL